MGDWVPETRIKGEVKHNNFKIQFCLQTCATEDGAVRWLVGCERVGQQREQEPGYPQAWRWLGGAACPWLVFAVRSDGGLKLHVMTA